MDHIEEARRVLFTRVQSVDSENAFKIMGYLLLQDWGEQDLLRVALGPEAVLCSVIMKAKKELGLGNKPATLQLAQPFSQPFSQSPSEVEDFMSPYTRALHSPSPASPCKSPSSDSYFLAPNFRFGMNHSSSNYPEFHEQWPAVPPPPHMYDKTPISHGFHEKLYNPRQNHFYTYKEHDNFLPLHPKWVSPSPSLADGNIPHYNYLSSKPCLFFSRGYCKHGSNCRFTHTIESEKCNRSLSFMEDVESTGSEDSFLMLASFDSLEQELKELLKGKHLPVSIASLPQLYYERFGKSLQAEGYLTESQRHGKAGFSLTKLLMRMKGIVSLIERPHGQHAVMLTEDALLFNEARGFRDDFSNMNASSRQIYLTFPAESTFTEDDVTIHFRAYGPVQDVRIPYQQKRMFGFVTFVYADTVRTILTEGNPHYICGARVLVKPYKEKGKTGDRKLHERDQLKHVPVANYLPVRRYEKEGEHVISPVEDERAATLEQSLADLQLNESRQSNFSTAERQIAFSGASQSIDETLVSAELDPAGDGALSADDVFSIQSSNFKYVLDLLDGESKDTDTTDSTIVTVSRLDSKPLDIQFGSADISDTVVANSMQMVKNQHLNSQNTRLMQHSWGAPTLFARSVF